MSIVDRKSMIKNKAFSDVAYITQTLMDTITTAPNGHQLTDEQLEVYHCIFNRIARSVATGSETADPKTMQYVRQYAHTLYKFQLRSKKVKDIEDFFKARNSTPVAKVKPRGETKTVLHKDPVAYHKKPEAHTVKVDTVSMFTDVWMGDSDDA